MACPSESLLQRFVEGELSFEDGQDLTEHLDGCTDCRGLVAAASPLLVSENAAFDKIGRYRLLRIRGVGGMGVVYEALDPELHRNVAIKVLRSEYSPASEQDRLVREAQAMAKLSHPNVVAVHDIGRLGEQVYVVMDLVDGMNLRDWMLRETRSQDDIVAALVSAGEGLCAAHAAGLIHRDLKPENIFVTRGGTGIVGDFGLSVLAESRLDAARIAGEGTPGYMAPEQELGASANERSDQWSFCRVAYEALTCTLPGVPAEPKHRSKQLPRWLARVLARGLDSDPSKRFPSVPALLDAISRGRRLTRAMPMAAGALLVMGLLLGTTFLAGARRMKAAEVCTGGEQEVAHVWNADKRDTVRRAFAQTGATRWEADWSTAASALSSYADSWQQLHRETCLSTRVRREQSDALLDQKMHCLGDRLRQMRAVVAVLEGADAALLERLPSLLSVLEPLETCDRLVPEAALSLPAAPSAEQLLRVNEAREVITRAATTLVAGRYSDGLTLAKEGDRLAQATRYLPVVAEAKLELGIAHGRLGQLSEAESMLEQAAAAASASGDKRTAIRAWVKLMHFVGFEAKRLQDAHRYNEYAEAALQSMTDTAELETERLLWLSAVLIAQKRWDEALIASERQLSLVELRHGKRHTHYAVALDAIAGILAGNGKNRQALAPQKEACAILEEHLGSPHPRVALCLGNYGGLYANLGEHERSLEQKRQALVMFEALPPSPAHVAMTRRNVARSLLELGRLGEARKEIEVAASLAQGPADRVSLQRLRGELARREGKRTQAISEHRAALVLAEQQAGPSASESLESLGALAIEAKRWSEARDWAERATRLVETHHGPRTFRLSNPLRLHAEALLGQGKRADAEPLATRALGLLEAAEVDPLSHARVALTLARSLPADARDRALSLAVSARDTARSVGPRGREQVAAIDAWLATEGSKR